MEINSKVVARNCVKLVKYYEHKEKYFIFMLQFKTTIMKKILLSLFFLASVAGNAQITIFEDSFETYSNFAISGVGGWTLTDVDGLTTYGVEQGTPPVSVAFANSGSPMAFIVMNSTASTPALNAGWAGHTGAKCMAAMASIPPTGSGLTNNDWLISPRMQLGTAGNTLKFWVKAISAAYPERYRVAISTTGTAPADFTILSAGTGVTPTTTWAEQTYNISNTYQGQNVYFAIQCISNDAFALLVDDFKVTATTLSANDFFAKNFSVYPNPSNEILNVTGKNNTAIEALQLVDLNGRVVKNVNANGVFDMQINIADLTSGVYFLNIKTEAGSGTTKIVKN